MRSGHAVKNAKLEEKHTDGVMECTKASPYLQPPPPASPLVSYLADLVREAPEAGLVEEEEKEWAAGSVGDLKRREVNGVTGMIMGPLATLKHGH